jgi:hypothetical protein
MKAFWLLTKGGAFHRVNKDTGWRVELHNGKRVIVWTV